MQIIPRWRICKPAVGYTIGIFESKHDNIIITVATRIRERI